ncbi:MAG: DEAD/DEAH box helicase [Methylophaga sp.]|nr:MAG: DEAD/DEAH box helicase [Methylophaga sp.]
MTRKDSHSREELLRLREENNRLKSLLNQHGIIWEEKIEVPTLDVPANLPANNLSLSIKEKIELFRRFFRGRDDVYPQRWESTKGKAGYVPACGNEWKPGVCHKPRVKCGQCSKRMLLPVSDEMIFNHLSGKQTIGVYPLLNDNHCYFLAVDFDKQEWREDAGAFMQSCRELDIPAALEISRSGNGAHVWIFFAAPVPAREARLLGAALISHTCERTRQLSLASYDRLFPNQDTMPKGGFGNLIALPLQKFPREHGCSVFVDEQFEPYADQWHFLASIHPMTRPELDKALLRSNGGRHPLDVAFELDVEDNDKKPWQRSFSNSRSISCDLPESLTLVLANQIFIAKANLPQPLSNRLIRLAAFQNPEFYKAQAMRMPVWNKPRIIGCAENFSQYIGLPRGCLDDVLSLLEKNSITPDVQDERVSGGKITAKFMGKLRKDQKMAVRALFKHEVGVLSAPTAFGKTVIAAAMIARRKVSTLVLVHRTELLRQWQERLSSFLDLPKGGLGIVGGGKKKLSGKVDIAVMQSLVRMENLSGLLDGYGQIIVDECHHIAAFSFETVLKQTKARYILGLTATPVRRDGHQPIIHMQCGPIRHAAVKSEVAPTQLEVWPQYLPVPEIPMDSPIQTTFQILTTDEKRNRKISKDILRAYREGRKILVLTERTDHIALLREGLGDDVEHCFVLHGRLPKKQRASIFAELKSLEGSIPHVLLATGRLIGEGFDHPPFDTLVLAMPISWKGTLQQYAGRLHRAHADKHDIRIYDYVESDHPQLSRMWDKRQRGYHAMEYKIIQPETKETML